MSRSYEFTIILKFLVFFFICKERVSFVSNTFVSIYFLLSVFLTRKTNFLTIGENNYHLLGRRFCERMANYMQQIAKQIAENATFQAFMNCYIREVKSGHWIKRRSG